MKKRARDINQLGKLMKDIATSDVKDEEASHESTNDEADKNPPIPRLSR